MRKWAQTNLQGIFKLVITSRKTLGGGKDYGVKPTTEGEEKNL